MSHFEQIFLLELFRISTISIKVSTLQCQVSPSLPSPPPYTYRKRSTGGVLEREAFPCQIPKKVSCLFECSKRESKETVWQKPCCLFSYVKVATPPPLKKSTTTKIKHGYRWKSNNKLHCDSIFLCGFAKIIRLRFSFMNFFVFTDPSRLSHECHHGSVDSSGE